MNSEGPKIIAYLISKIIFIKPIYNKNFKFIKQFRLVLLKSNFLNARLKTKVKKSNAMNKDKEER